MSQIKVVALDLGNVVLDADIEGQLRKVGIHEPWETLSQWPVHWDFETGKLSTEGFYEEVRQRFSLKHSDLEIERAWLAIIRGFLPGIPELLRDIHQSAKLVAITNTNPPHKKLFEEMPEFRNFHQIFASHEVGHRKPDRGIYDAVISELRVQPNEIAFFDDLHENVDAAVSLGIRAFHCYRDADLIRNTLKNLKVL